MSRYKKKYEKKSFESTGISSDTSANIYMSMLLSDAWKNLTANQQRLYLYCKAQYYAEKKKPRDDPLCFTMNKSKWSKLYGLYDSSNGKGFIRDMTALIQFGFVSCVECGASSKTKSIYRFSAKWREYDAEHPEQFSINPADKTIAMWHRERKEMA